MYFNSPVQIISMTSATMTCGYAVWRGGRPEKLIGYLLLADWYASPVLGKLALFGNAQILVFAVDGLVAVILLHLALTSNRFWPLWAASFQILELIMHVAAMIDHHVHARAYFVGVEISSYLILAAVALGAWREGANRNDLVAAASL